MQKVMVMKGPKEERDYILTLSGRDGVSTKHAHADTESERAAAKAKVLAPISPQPA